MGTKNNDNIFRKLIGTYIEITSSCNSNCKYCYNNSKKNGIHLDFEYIKEAIDEVCKCNENPVIVISGGEPFLHPNFIDIINFINERNVKFKLITNGTGLTNYNIIDKLYNCEIQLTIESSNAEKHNKIRGKNNFELLENFFSNDNKYKVSKVNLRVNISRRNFNEIEKLVDLAIKWNVDVLQFSFLSNLGRAETDADIINLYHDIETANKIIFDIEKIKETFSNNCIKIVNRCLPKTSCTYLDSNRINATIKICPNGDIYPCESFIHSDYIIGNIKKQSIFDILNSEKFTLFTNNLHLKNKVICEKNNCVFNRICLKGCPAETINNSEKIMDELCKYYRKYYTRQFNKIIYY